MIKKFCDICGKEVTEPHPMSNARYPMYEITKMTYSGGYIGADVQKVDLCDEHEKALEEFKKLAEANFNEDDRIRKSELSRAAWDNFRAFKYAMNHVPIEIIEPIDDYLWRHEAILGGEEYRLEYEKIPEGAKKKIHADWAKMSLEGLNGVAKWMETQISEGKICLRQMDEPPAGQPDSPDTQIHFQTADNLHREQ